MKAIFFTAIFLLAASPEPSMAVDTEYLQGLGDSNYHRIESQHVGRGYHIYVMVPAGYDESGEDTYPTIYLLDGGGLFPLMAAYYRYLNFGREIPDVIIVGISYGTDMVDGGNFRSTDYTAPSSEREYFGGAETFQKFLSDELIPVIEQQYRSDAKRRVIFGQSIGGQFVLYSALTKPDLFWGHIASNPALHRNLPFFLKTHIESGSNNSRSRLFVANGTLDDPRFQEPAQEWISHWSAVEPKPWELKTADLDGHSHMSAPPAAFRQGLHWLFSETVDTQSSAR